MEPEGYHTMKLTTHFALAEFGHAIPPRVAKNLQVLAGELEVIRTHTGGPIIITSGFRTLAKNAAIGGARGSGHVLGHAADVYRPGMTPSDLFRRIEQLEAQGLVHLDQVIQYRTHVHISTDPRLRGQFFLNMK